MARRHEVKDDELFLTATYLATTGADTEIHAEIPTRYRDDFETNYACATNNFALPVETDQHPYYVWPAWTRKRGTQLRVYFTAVSPQPPFILTLNPKYGQWFSQNSRYRINHTNLVMQLFKCGFVLGRNNNNSDRIAHFMQQKFPTTLG